MKRRKDGLDSSVADPECLSRIPDQNFSSRIPDSGSKRFPDPGSGTLTNTLMKEEKEEDKKEEVNELIKKNNRPFLKEEKEQEVGVDEYLAGSNRQL